MSSLKTVADGLREIADSIAPDCIDSIYIDDNERVVCRVKAEAFVNMAKVCKVVIECSEYAAEPWIHHEAYSINCPEGIEDLFLLGLFTTPLDCVGLEVVDKRDNESL